MSYLLSRYARHTKQKQKRYTKLEGLSGRLRRASMRATTQLGLELSERMRLLATYAEKERKKMTHSKPITFKLQLTEQPQNYYQLIEAVIDEEATNP